VKEGGKEGGRERRREGRKLWIEQSSKIFSVL
jgi:hypothetical protein